MGKHKKVESAEGNTFEIAGKDNFEKPTKEEVNFREGGGIPQFECSACQNFESGFCRLLKLAVEPGDICDAFVENFKDGRKSNVKAQTEVLMRTVEVPLFISRVSIDRQTGERRWYATASGIEKDLYKERMSVELYKDFITRIETREPAPEQFTSDAWTGGLPYLGIAHYLDLDGYGIIGPTDQVYIDGKVLKMRGRFGDSELANKAYDAIQEDIANKTEQDERIRVSIAFIDWSHNHEGVGSFVRESLSQICPHCEEGVGEKIYVAGQLVHLALTRRPAYLDTDITLQERTMENKSSQKEDAASIVGDDLAEELEERKALTQRADLEDVADGAIVIKDKHGDPEDYEDDEDDDDEKRKKKKRRKDKDEEGAAFTSYLGGAKSLDEADAFLEKSEVGLIDSWGVFADVLSNSVSKEDEPIVRAVVKDFQSRLDILTAKAVVDIQKALNGGNSMADDKAPDKVDAVTDDAVTEPVAPVEPVAPAAHVLDDALVAMKSAFDDAVDTPGEAKDKLAMLQPAFNDLAEVVQQRVVNPSGEVAPAGGVTLEQMQQLMAPLYAEIESLKTRTVAPAAREPASNPTRRAISAQRGALPIAQIQPPVKPGSLKDIMRRSVGLTT